MLAMDTQQPRRPEPTLRAIYNHLVKNLREMLPPPIGDTPDDLVRRDLAAITLAASLAPANAAEAGLTAQYVAFSAHATYSPWLVQQLPPVDKLTMTLRAQSASAGRDARHYRSKLLTLQQQRYKREADDIAARQKSPQHEGGQGAVGGLATPSGAAVASPALPGRPPPAFRVIEGGLES
jgi:hypothetical protein